MTHDESIPLYGYVGRKPSSHDDHAPRVPQPTAERDINAVIPVLNFSLGTEKHAFTVQDIINRAKVLGINTDDLRWMYSQANNYLPPIDIDRFANFYNYFWVAKAIPAVPAMAWNAELLPEYYTIARPQPSDLDKLNVVAASTHPVVLTGSGFDDQSFTLTFTSPTTFVVSADNSLGSFYTWAGGAGSNQVLSSMSSYACTLQPATTEQAFEDNFTFKVTNSLGDEVELLSFTVSREPMYDSLGVWIGNTSFAAGDSFAIDSVFLSYTYNVVFTGSPGVKGKIKNVDALKVYQTIDGILLEEGNRVLVKNNTATENGIYIVGPQAWTRAQDYEGANIVAGAKVWVAGGTVNGGMLFTSGAGNSWSGAPSQNNTNDWQEGNYWVHATELEALNLSRAVVTQAVRPIIEYISSTQLNSSVSGGVPTEGGAVSFKQEKTEFNQLPLFDLFRYDGTHSGKVSAIFYYVEDLTADLDLDLQKRVKTSSSDSADYVFNHGLADDQGDLLFYKANGALKSIWHAGYSEATIVDQTFIGDDAATKGTLTSIVASFQTQQQIWTLRATSPTTFVVSGSKTAVLPAGVDTLTVGVPYSNADFSCVITAGALPFAIDDTFMFRIGNLETPRYVYRDDNDTMFDLYGGPAADTSGIGAYQVSRSFINNPYNESRDEVLEGTLYSHFRGIIQNQPEGVTPNYAFGGAIKNWSEQQTLLASLLIQRDITPISMIDLAQREYDAGLNAVADIYKQNIAQYFATNGVVDIDGTIEQQNNLENLLASILELRKLDNDVRTVLYDSTSAVVGFPATLPQLGILQLVTPTIGFDNVLGQTLITHHDGHNSPLYADGVEFRRAILYDTASIEVVHADGSKSAAVGSFTTTAPVRPHKGTLWIYPNGAESIMYAFDVDSDFNAPTSPAIGATWYQREAGAQGTLSIWDGVQWVVQPTHATQWRVIDLADTLNQLVLLVEKKLHAGINPNSRKVDFTPLMSDAGFKIQLERELFSFAALNGLVPLGSDYQASDAMTWNYSSALPANFPPLATGSVPARWYNVLKAHQTTVAGVIPTERPNLEPWKLFGFQTFALWAASLTPAQQAAYSSYALPSDLPSMIDGGNVRAVETSFVLTSLFGLQVIDGVSLVAGDKVLLQNQIGPSNNGVWIVSSGAWVRSPLPLTLNTYVTVTSGVDNFSTTWALSSAVTTLNVDPVLFKQVRHWSDQLWVDVAIARPTLRLSVDTRRDTILPPYVSAATAQSVNALTTVMPTGLSATYSFGDGGPVESVWLSSLEFGYSLARALFRHDPMMFLGFCWGFNWVEVDGIMYDGYDVNTPGHKRFRLHGEAVRQIDRSTSPTSTTPALLVSAVTGTAPVDVTLTFDAYEVVGANRYQNFSVKDTVTGETLAYVREGVFSTISTGSVSLTNLVISDFGRPFHTGDKFRITADAAGSNVVITFTPTPIYQYLGFGQTFTNALRAIAVDTTDSFAIEAYRGWDVNMGYRAGGLVATSDLSVRTDSDTLSTSSYDLIFKKNEAAKDIWIQGLRITVSTFGSTVDTSSGFAPVSDGSDWVFQIEGYNPRYSNISYYALNTAGDFETFNVLDQSATTTSWKHFTSYNGVVESFLPLTITGIQNVTNFLFGYSDYLTSLGWEFNKDLTSNVDAETGRARTWQLEIEKFIDRCYRGMTAGQGHIVNPFMDQIWVRQDQGLLSEFKDTALFDITGNPGVFDIAGIKMVANDLYVVRGNTESQFGAAAPMYSVHAQFDEYEHLFIFNWYVEDSINNGVLYQPFSGSRVITYKFNGRRQASQTFRPEFGGHFLVGNEVRQNIQASSDNIANFYDANHAFENDTTTRHALAVLGFSTKTYFDDLGISDKSQFNFWRGLIQSKGTNMSIGAYLNNDRFEDAKVDEYWAYKVAEYGDARQNTYPELKLSVNDTVQQYTQLQFDSTPANGILDNFTQIDRLDESRWFSLDDLDQDAYFKAETVGVYTRPTVALDETITLPFVADKLVIGGTAVVTKYNATTLVVTTAGSLSVVGFGPATPRYNPIKLFNYVANELIEEIPLWHPAFGQHTPTALESINVIASQNPAKYNFSTQVVNNNSYDPLRPWGSNEIGRTWFDTRNLAYIPYYDEAIFANRPERLSRWGALADFATIDVYEWVQSSVPPKEYNALALAQAGNADLDPSTKAGGEVALEETYVRDREWSIRPIAWSYSPVPTASAHPSFNNSFESKLFTNVGTNMMSLERGLFSDYGITAGMRIGAWDPTDADPKPLSEAIVSTEFTKILIDQTTNTDLAPIVPTVSVVNPVVPLCSVELAVTGYSSIAGPLLFAAESNLPVRRADTDGLFIDEWETSIQFRVSEVDGLTYEIVTLNSTVGTVVAPGADNLHGATIVLAADEVFSYSIPGFGLTVNVTVTTAGTYAADALRNAIVAALGSQVAARDAVKVSDVVSITLSSLASPEELSNDPADLSPNGTIGWRAWSVPTQAQLTADGRQPNASWKPYLGEFVSVPAITIEQVQDAVAYAADPLMLNDSTSIQRYTTTWSDWSVLKNIVLSTTQTSSTPVTLTHTANIDEASTSVYVNGIAQLKAAFTISGKTLTVNSGNVGSMITAIIRHYEPSAEELAFDPEVVDDLTYQQQFKTDFEYVSLPVRDSEGSITSSLYYFWVKNKSTAASNKKLSVQAIAQELRDGPPNFLTFQHIIGGGTSNDPYRYDAITISGLSYIVGKDDTFKLRFTRDFTLRDDPQNLDLKDTHAEWSLIRPAQRTKIPEALWQKLTDSVAGLDKAGNAIPALRRSLYDERNGTALQFGFGSEQTLAPKDLLSSSITYTIVNTKLINKSVPANSSGVYPPDFIEFLDFDQSDSWFASPEAARQTMTDIWNSAKVSQINEIFFAALNDILASNYEMSDIFKTSRLSAYSIKVVAAAPAQPTYE
jgi:hypothetical protein